MLSDIKNYLLTKQGRLRLFQYSNYFFIATLPLWNNINTISLWVLVFMSLLAVSFKERLANIKVHATPLMIIGGLYLLYILGVFFSENASLALRDVEKTLTLLIIPLILFSHKKEDFNEKLTIVFLGTGLMAGILICWGNVVHSILNRDSKMWLDQASYFFEWVYTDWNLVKPLDTHPSYFGVLIVIFLYGLLSNGDFKDFRKKYVKLVLLITPYLVFLIATSSRIALLSLILLMGFLFFKNKNKNKKKWLSLFFVIPVFLFLFSNTDYLVRKSSQIVDSDGNITLDRYQRWKDIWQVFQIQDSFFTGVGIGNTQEIYNQAYILGAHKTAYFNHYNAHNQYLEFFVGMGLIGLMYYLFVIGYWIKITRLKALSLAIILILTLFSMSESIFKRSQGIFIFAYFYSLTIILYQSQLKSNPRK